MKPSILDRIIGIFSPKAALNRASFRAAMNQVRAYESASLSNLEDWHTASRASQNSETRAALTITRDRARDLTRNNAYANKALNVIVSNTVGAGITLKIKGRTVSQERILTKKWQQWAETTACDKYGKKNFYGIQAAALRSIVESGEVLIKKLMIDGTAKLQMLEPDFINGHLNNNISNVQGLWLDTDETILAYEMYTSHPGDWRAYNLKSIRVPASEIIHAFREERIGQLRGMPWASPIVNDIKDFSDYQNATLLRQKIAACFTAFITAKDGDGLLSPDVLKQQREQENSLEPGSMRYLAPGQSMQFASPPAVDQYDAFVRQTLRKIAAGFGITTESMTGDFSQFSFSSSRMSFLEMERNINSWRWQMMIPQVCNPVFQLFLQWCQILGMDITGVTAQWTPPAREMIDPVAEIAALKGAVRAGFKTLPEAIREQGLDPDSLFEEVAETNAKLDKLGLIFDTDPRQITDQGMMQMISKPAEPADPNAQNGDTTGGQQNKKDASDASSTSGTK